MPPYYDYDYDDNGGAQLTSRRLVIGAAAVAVVCIAFLIGYGARGDGSGSPKAAPRPSQLSTTRTVRPAAGLDSTTIAKPTHPSTAVRSPLPRNSAGVIVGYRHDAQGAVAAAGNYTAALYVQTNRTHARELAVLTSIAATPGDATRMADDFSSEDAALAKLLDLPNLRSPGVIAYGHPVGYRIESSSSTAATVDVYVIGGQGVAGAPGDSGATGETFYEVDQVQLAWQPGVGAGDWRLANWSHLVQDNGPKLATVAAEGYLPFPIGQTGPAADTRRGKTGNGTD